MFWIVRQLSTHLKKEMDIDLSEKHFRALTKHLYPKQPHGFSKLGNGPSLL